MISHILSWFTSQVEELEEGRLAAIKQFARGSRSVLNPMACVFGGLIGQEAVKAATNKYTPIHQVGCRSSLLLLILRLSTIASSVICVDLLVL